MKIDSLSCATELKCCFAFANNRGFFQVIGISLSCFTSKSVIAMHLHLFHSKWHVATICAILIFMCNVIMNRNCHHPASMLLVDHDNQDSYFILSRVIKTLCEAKYFEKIIKFDRRKKCGKFIFGLHRNFVKILNALKKVIITII